MGRTNAALVRLLAAQGQEIEDRVRDTHSAIAGRVFRAVGPIASPLQAIHDAIGERVHAGVRLGLGIAGEVGARVAEQVDDGLARDDPRGVQFVGAVLGLAGHTIRVEEPDIDWPTQLRSPDGRLLATHDDGISGVVDRVGAATVVVLLHGLCETEHAWWWGTDSLRVALPDRLEAPGRAVVLARVNSGRRPAEVGREIADLLAALLTPRTRRVVLVGHSMGGLVARAAVRAGDQAGHVWVDACDTIVTLGTPHLGAPLEKAVEALVRAGALAPEVDAITRWFDQRSDGIRDLRHGTTSDEGPPGPPVRASALPPHVTLHTVGAAFEGFAGRAFGDGLVRERSAHARGRRTDVLHARSTSLHVMGRSHLDLLVDPEVTAHVERIVAEPGDRSAS